ncbi:hypothetical protein AAY473_024974 [Plecturocebus cupreus]
MVACSYSPSCAETVSLLPELECSGTIIAHCSLQSLGSSDTPGTASRVAANTGTRHQMGYLCVTQAGLELLASSNSPTLASQSAGIKGMSHQARPFVFILMTPNTGTGLAQKILLEPKLIVTESRLFLRLEYSVMILTHYNFHLPGSSDSLALASQVAGITGKMRIAMVSTSLDCYGMCSKNLSKNLTHGKHQINISDGDGEDDDSSDGDDEDDDHGDGDGGDGDGDGDDDDSSDGDEEDDDGDGDGSDGGDGDGDGEDDDGDGEDDDSDGDGGDGDGDGEDDDGNGEDDDGDGDDVGNGDDKDDDGDGDDVGNGDDKDEDGDDDDSDIDYGVCDGEGVGMRWCGDVLDADDKDDDGDDDDDSDIDYGDDDGEDEDALWEAKAGESQGQEIKTILANMLLGRLRQENRLNTGCRGCSELRSHHCTPAWRQRPAPTRFWLLGPQGRLQAGLDTSYSQLALSLGRTGRKGHLDKPKPLALTLKKETAKSWCSAADWLRMAEDSAGFSQDLVHALNGVQNPGWGSRALSSTAASIPDLLCAHSQAASPHWAVSFSAK